ncbi:hypothetical protein POM88_006472 [Heracleum sosnowskyi]|uniref:Uncharacterized protein n=1 Tax=Heracleum sosnowskyi TaxID=360622 RepID=A0AAD8J2T0_9APIA|nr:hypothetical protein POM88_006472 [Heracleum sosnowskyi]
MLSISKADVQLGHENYIRFGEGGGDGEPDQGGWGQGFPFGVGPFGGEDIFNKIFGSRDFGGKDVKVSLELSFMEAVQGCTRTVMFQTELPCGGSGVPPGTKSETCRRCRGAGQGCKVVHSESRLLVVSVAGVIYMPAIAKNTYPHRYSTSTLRLILKGLSSPGAPNRLLKCTNGVNLSEEMRYQFKAWLWRHEMWQSSWSSLDSWEKHSQKSGIKRTSENSIWYVRSRRLYEVILIIKTDCDDISGNTMFEAKISLPDQ